MNLVDADSVALAISTFKPNVIIHTAAQSSPAASSKDPEGSMSINAPRALLDAIEKVPASKRPLLIYISTDQVFNGSIEGGGQPYPSDTPPKPVNAYGSSKAAFESMLQESKLPFVVLRSSNMVGEPAPFSGASKFLQWLEVKLSVKESEDDSAVDLFEDEVRSFVHVDDVVKAIRTLVAIWQSPENSTSTSAGVVVCNNDSSGSSNVGVGRKDAQLASDLWGLWRSGSGGVYNMGGPQGLSRVGLARALATARPTECSLLLKDGHSPKVFKTKNQISSPHTLLLQF
jgi:dTDP-4-dehydrorhamnose reductase